MKYFFLSFIFLTISSCSPTEEAPNVVAEKFLKLYDSGKYKEASEYAIWTLKRDLERAGKGKDYGDLARDLSKVVGNDTVKLLYYNANSLELVMKKEKEGWKVGAVTITPEGKKMIE